MVVAFRRRKWRLSHSDCMGDESGYSLAKEGKETDKKEGRKEGLAEIRWSCVSMKNAKQCEVGN